MIAVCKKDIFSRIDNELLFIKNKKYNYTKINTHYDIFKQIVCETKYKITLRPNTFYDIFYTTKEYRKLKLEKLKSIDI